MPNVIEVARKLVGEFPKIKEFTDTIQVDFTKASAEDNYGLSHVGDNLVSKSICGDEKRISNFQLYAVRQSVNDSDRLENSSFLLELGYWLESQRGIEVTADKCNKVMNGEITKITCGNSMLFEPFSESQENGGIYYIQIGIEYTLESEE